MKDDKFFWNYKEQPGKVLKKDYITDTKQSPLVSIITSYYNAQEFMWQTINCILNQTFPYWEWIIVDDGSTDKKAIEYLENIKKMDTRIYVYHKKNEGLAKGRDYAIKYSTTNYILPLDADDLIEPTYIETLYWAMEKNKEAAWAFTNSLGFGKYIYLVDQPFDSEKMKTENHITATALIRKNKILQLGGYGVAKRYVNEDWHLWLRMLANKEYPIQLTYYGFWYRRREKSLLTQINDEKSKENELRLRDIKTEADKIKSKVEPLIFPQKNLQNINSLKYYDFDWNRVLPKASKENILYILPATGMDKKTYRQIKKKKGIYNIFIITLENIEHSHYALRQKYEKFATVFDLTTFLGQESWLGFIKYIVKTRMISDIYVAEKYSNIEFFKEELRFKETVKYKENNLLYKLAILNYRLKNTLIGRATRKIIRILRKDEI